MAFLWGSCLSTSINWKLLFKRSDITSSLCDLLRCGDSGFQKTGQGRGLGLDQPELAHIVLKVVENLGPPMAAGVVDKLPNQRPQVVAVGLDIFPGDPLQL